MMRTLDVLIKVSCYQFSFKLTQHIIYAPNIQNIPNISCITTA